MASVTEEWKTINGTKYQISNHGRVKGPADNLLTPWNDKGYMRVGIVYGEKRKIKRVHCLVAEAFIGKSEIEGVEINHIDGIRTNNRVENIEYVTHQENIDHAKRTGLLDSKTGERHYRAKLTAAQVAEIRSQLSSGKTSIEIAKRYGIYHGTVRQIKRRDIWKSVA